MTPHRSQSTAAASRIPVTVDRIRKKLLGKQKILVRSASLDDIEEMLLVENEAWKEPRQRATREMIQARIETFPEGILVAESEGCIWGYVVVQRMKGEIFSDKNRKLSWAEITDNGMIRSTHDPEGDILYGVNLSVSSVSPTGTQFRLMENVGKLAIRLNAKEILLGGRIPSFYKFQDCMTADEYIRWSVKNRPRDPELWMYSRAGLEIVRAIPNYFPDPGSCNYGVLLRWRNPFYGRPAIFRWIASKLFKI